MQSACGVLADIFSSLTAILCRYGFLCQMETGVAVVAVAQALASAGPLCSLGHRDRQMHLFYYKKNNNLKSNGKMK